MNMVLDAIQTVFSTVGGTFNINMVLDAIQTVFSTVGNKKVADNTIL
jgi:hypothetical protein